MILFIILFMLLVVIKQKNVKYEYLLYSIVCGTLALFVITEILSWFNKYELSYLLFAFGTLNTIICVYDLTHIKDFLKNISKEKIILKKDTIIFLALFIILGIISVVMALNTTPYNWDSMTYHLGRVAHWSQNKSVSYYATHIIRQLASPVLGEYVVLYFYTICRGNDICVNLVQSISYILNALIIWNIAKKLNGRSKTCFLASLLFMTTPIAFAESLTTQVDNFATIWMLIFAFFAIDFMDINSKIYFDEITVRKALMMAFSVAFGYLSKPSVGISMLIMALAILIICILRHDSVKEIIKIVIVSTPCVICPVLIGIYRNFVTFGKMSASITGQRQLIGTLNPRYLFVNCLKNIFYNLPNVYDGNSQTRIYDFVSKVANLLHVNINDCSIAEDGAEYIVWNARMNTVDSAVNPIIVTLAILCFVWIIVLICTNKFKIRNKVMNFSLAVLLAFFIFCSVLRWEAFVSRYMISYFALLCIAVSLQLQYMVDCFNKCNTYIVYMIVGIIAFTSIMEYISAVEYHRSYIDNYRDVDRCQAYFANRMGMYEPYKRAVEYIDEKGYNKIGFICSEDHYDYPLIKMLEDKNLQHISVQNESAIYEKSDYHPDCIFVVGTYIDGSYQYNSETYHVAYEENEGWIYMLVKAE